MEVPVHDNICLVQNDTNVLTICIVSASFWSDSTVDSGVRDETVLAFIQSFAIKS
ncbi:MAG: hypothetical protein AB7U98_02880 [Candidatus Nitrosocosmicus sp.]